MKKLIATLFTTAALALTACQSTMTSAEMKANLEKKEYTVEIMGAEETKVRIQGVNFNVDIKDSLLSTKGDKDVILAFFVTNSKDADAFVKENVSALYKFAQRYTEDPKTGYHNNVCYTGSPDAVKAAGLPV